MNILLIGKFSPCQGGVSSKFYWLFTALKKHYGVSWHAITIRKIPYSSDIPQKMLDSVTVLDDLDSSIPWFIPKTDLIVDRLVSAGMHRNSLHEIDLVIVNYLEPFLSAGWILSTVLNKPLIIQPAGSDYHKFLQHEKLKFAIETYLRKGKYILLPEEKIEDFRHKMPSIAKSVTVPVKRYIPDPEFYHPSPSPMQSTYERNGRRIKDILFAGKINQYWSLHNFSLLVPFLHSHKDYRLKCIIDGSHCDQFVDFLDKNISNDQLVIIRGFVSPDRVPNEIAKSCAVWNYISSGGIVDFPNTHWETIASGRYSLVSDFLLSQPDIKLSDSFKALTINADLPSFGTCLENDIGANRIQAAYAEFKKLHFEYLEDMMKLYSNAVK